VSEFDLECVLKGKYKGGRLENWYITDHGLDDDGLPVKGAHGNIYEDDRFRTGEYIHTSAIINHYVEENIVETLNTYYTLGRPAGKDRGSDADPRTKEQLDMLIRAMI
jgi:hypothetical protein